MKKYKYIYGPVSSWRLGRSLGIDIISAKDKICNFDCVYCQLGPTNIFTNTRKIFVPTEKLLKEIRSLPPIKADYLTFSGRGEPTLAANLGEAIKEVKKIRKESVAVITNSSLVYRKDVRKDLSLADFVLLKLDSPSKYGFHSINKPMKGVEFDKILRAIKGFAKLYKGRLGLQVMFTEENKAYAPQIAEIAKKINPREIQINTPLRPSGSKPLSRKEIGDIKKYFKGARIVSVYEAERKKVRYIDKKDTLKRRGKRP